MVVAVILPVFLVGGAVSRPWWAVSGGTRAVRGGAVCTLPSRGIQTAPAAGCHTKGHVATCPVSGYPLPPG